MTSKTAEHVAAKLVRSLTVWGGASTVAGGVLALTGATPAKRAFGQQTAGWGAIDLAIAAVAAARPAPTSSSRLRTVLVVNAGLDILYVAAGTYMAARRPRFGGRLSRAESLAHGAAIMVQGAALLILDTTHARELYIAREQGRRN